MQQKKYGDALKYLNKVLLSDYTNYHNKAQELIDEIKSMNLSQEELVSLEEEYNLKSNEAADLIDNKKYEEGLKLINKIFLEFNNGYDFWDYNDFALNNLANTKETIGFLKDLIEENHKNIDVYFRLGSLYDENGEYETAIEYYDFIIDYGNEIQESYGNLYKAQSLRKLKRFDEAMEIADWGIGHGEDISDFMEEKCFIYIDTGDFDLATKTIDELSNFKDVSCVKGYFFLQTKEYDKAIEFFKKQVNRSSMDIFSIPARSKFYLALAFKKAKKHKESLKYLRQIKLKNNNKRYYDKAQDLIAEIENDKMVKD